MYVFRGLKESSEPCQTIALSLIICYRLNSQHSCLIGFVKEHKNTLCWRWEDVAISLDKKTQLYRERERRISLGKKSSALVKGELSFPNSEMLLEKDF